MTVHSRRQILAVGLAGLAGAALSACSSLTPSGDVSGSRIVSTAAIGRVNAFREANGQKALEVDRHASHAALAQAKNMAAHQEMEHNIGIGANFARRMKKGDVPLPAAENIATGQQSVEAAVVAWENSPPHRRNMLDSRFTGVGVAVASNTETGRPYWSMVLTGG